MASLQAKADAVKTAIASTISCTTATVVTAKELLLADAETTKAISRPVSRAERPTTSSRTKKTAESRTANSKSTGTGQGKDELSLKDKAALATHIINAGIKSLTEAAKPPPASTPHKRRPSAGEIRSPADARTLRRSISAPLSPLQPRTLNRTATSPSAASKTTKVAAAGPSTGCLATVECLRAAFSCLRSIRGAPQPKQTDFQLETGIAAFVGKLLALGLHDPALKELRILKKRLDLASSDGTKPAKSASPETSSAAQVVGELLDYEENVTNNSLAIITTCQVHALRLISISKKPAYIEAALPFLLESHPSSPTNLLLKLAKQNAKEAQKAARQLAALSQTLLALAPSVASKEDSIATERRLSPLPSSAFQLQILAFKTQLKWWKLAGHRGVVDDEIFSPFVRCARAFTRRQKLEEGRTYQIIASAFDELMQLAKPQISQQKISSDSPLSSMYQLLGSTAQSERLYDEAYRWFTSLKDSMHPDTDSYVRICSVSARLLSAALKRSKISPNVEDLLREVTEGLDSCLSGSITDLNELLESLSSARRSAVGLLVNNREKSVSKSTKSDGLNDLLKTFVLRYPRFARRWLGAPPGKDATAKQFLQFDQRRQTLSQSISQILDAALVVTNGDIQKGAMPWQQMDDILQDCTMLLDSVADPIASASRAEQLGTYFVKISSIYFSRFLQLRKETTKTKDINKQILQSLSRSIEVVKERSLALQEKAQLPTKLELFADLCKGAGRGDDAVRTLRSICTTMIEEGALVKVTTELASQPANLAWSANEKAETLSRTLRSIAKLDKSWNDWAFFLPEAERAAVLEHLMYISADSSARAKPLGLHASAVEALLRIYTVDRFPIRRLRVLLHLLFQNIGETIEIEEIKSLAKQVLDRIRNKALAEDAALSRFIPHLEALNSSLAAMVSVEVQFQEMKDAISSWRSLTESCRTRNDLYEKVDDPEGLIDHLRSASQFAELRGENSLQLSILELSTAITKTWEEQTRNQLVLSHSLLASQHLIIGHYLEAQKTLEMAKELIGEAEGVSRGVVAAFHLSQAQYFTGVGSIEEANAALILAKEICQGPASAWANSKTEANMALSLVSFLDSTVALKQGHVQEALSFIKNSVRLLSHDWAKAEASFSRENSPAETSISENSISDIQETTSSALVIGPQFWGLAFPLLRALLHLSSVYAHLGMFQETVYYAESAQKIAESTSSPLYQAQVAAWTASIYRRAERLDKALSLGDMARGYLPEEVSATRVQLACQLSDLYRELDSDDLATELLQIAEDTAQQLGNYQEVETAQDQSTKRVTATRTQGATSTSTTTATRATRTTRARAATTTSSTARTQKRTATAKVTKAKTAPTKDSVTLPKDVYQASLMASVILSRTLGFISQKNWSSALATLEQVKELPKLFATLSQEQIVTAVSLIGHSTEQMIHDPVFSVIQDSTISFPAISAAVDKGGAGKLSLSPPPKGRGGERKASKERGLPAFADALKKAQEILLEAHTSTLATASSTMVHRISTLLQSTVILLSATTTTRSKAVASSGFATFSVDLARNITWRREQSTLQTPKNMGQAGSQSSSAPRRSSLGLTTEMAKFQRDYVDLLPKNWSAISISLSENRHDLCITKFQASHSPFILRLPLERAYSRDADSEVFNFAHGREEMLDIIEKANETSHSAKDFSAKGARNAWWAEREALDSRLKELLDTIETTWLGGFKGIFSQHQRRPDLLARFQVSFQQILDNSLPSRNKLRGKKTAKGPSITLDPRILDLFIGLGDPNEPDSDFDEALNDLLYFVVDILQFHGERNAYDEIDFDAMVVETYDALRGYYEASKCDGERAEDAHTVLVLDKALHAFPWESIACMERLAVSRVPSLACLRQLIVEAKHPATESDEGQPEGHYVSADRGTYILNPSSDLKNTQSTFQPTFKSLPTWTSIVNRVPSEDDFEKALSTSEILLYFGHGSGAQYVRARTVRRLDKCRPATFLMGCSSAALTEAGEFEVYGPVWNYMMAGCPAVVGTLWDVTDRDIDRFAGRAFEHWGLFPHGTFKDDEKKKKSRAKKEEAAEEVTEADGPTSLAEAVARARNACKFKYLNAAAVVLYGIPVYIKKGTEE